jgi:hypothetical protein
MFDKRSYSPCEIAQLAGLMKQEVLYYRVYHQDKKFNFGYTMTKYWIYNPDHSEEYYVVKNDKVRANGRFILENEKSYESLGMFKSIVNATLKIKEDMEKKDLVNEQEKLLEVNPVADIMNRRVCGMSSTGFNPEFINTLLNSEFKFGN